MKAQYALVCHNCHAPFSHSQPHAKNCSEKCRREWSGLKSGRRKQGGMASGTAGAISELKIATDLMEKDLPVFRALSPACFCDLVVIKDGIAHKIECRTGYRHKSSGSVFYSKKLRGKIDIIAVYVYSDNKVLYFNPESFKEIAF